MQQLTIILASLGVAQAILLIAYLLGARSGSRQANLLLAMVLLGLSIRIGKSIFNHYLEIPPWQRNIGLSGLLMVGPCFWLYGKSLLQEGFRLQKQHGLHLLPMFVYVAFSWLIPNNFDFAAKLSYVFILTHLLTYLLISEKLRRSFDGIDLHQTVSTWLLKLGLGLFVILIYYTLVFLRVIPYYIGGAITYSVLLYGLTYLMLKNPVMSTKKYQKTGLGITESQQLFSIVQEYFDREQPFLNRNLTLEDVARHLKRSTREISQTINQNENSNFSEFVNSYRIEHAKNLLKDSQSNKTKIAVIALESGFGNVTSFNTCFKSKMNLTPSQFRNSCDAS